MASLISLPTPFGGAVAFKAGVQFNSHAATVAIPAGNLLYGLTEGLVGGGDMPLMVQWSYQDQLAQAFAVWDSMTRPVWQIDVALYDASGNELTSGNSPGYSRLTVGCGDSYGNWTVGSDALTIANAVPITFPVSTAAWVQCKSCGFFLHGDGVIQYGGITALQSPVTLTGALQQFSFPANSFVIKQPLR